MIDRIEYHVEHAVDYVQTATQVKANNWTITGSPFSIQSTKLAKSFPKYLYCIRAGHKEGAEVPVKGSAGEKTISNLINVLFML